MEIVGDSRALRVNSYFPLPLIYFLCIITREVGRSRRGSQLSFDRIAPSSGSFVPFFLRCPLGPVSRCTGTVTFCDVLCVTRNSRHEHNLGSRVSRVHSSSGSGPATDTNVCLPDCARSSELFLRLYAGKTTPRWIRVWHD